jgi:glutamate transport system permease protein
MKVLIDNLDAILKGFGTTIGLTICAALGALILGSILALMRVSPVPALRFFSAAYLQIFRNTPLVIVFILFVFGLPELGFTFSFFQRAAISLTVYTASFVCEALRSGLNSVQPGQIEAARAIGLTFNQTIKLVVAPQSFRAVIPPLASILIALAKNSAIAEAFGVVEATGTMDQLVNSYASALWWLFAGVAAGYILISLFVSAVFGFAERRLAVSR